MRRSSRRLRPASRRISSKRVTSKRLRQVSAAQVIPWVAGALIALVALMALAVKSSDRRSRRPPSPPAPPPVRRIRIPNPAHWRAVGFSDGRYWARRMSRRYAKPTAEEVSALADRKVSDYYKENLTPAEEEAYQEGFCKGAIRK